ncbi:T9SS response regulator signal transducer PorX [Sediminitomix flava]|uniref:Response regulator receiver domain-containing protein n=1 Tax=Sediminitomix flava TaxID=379075 RepID=A0A316A354_SEDFL|nr:PglZ domain-containing protein [Sediminitomix flava]PWJ44137.1 response regulator receiver domain-containing protein [Sediminitomix flava]
MTNQNYNILWADDEIDLLKPHILFLEQKGCSITPVNSGGDAVDLCQSTFFDLIFLDENMPGMTGLETLEAIKQFRPNTPVVMITKSEEEYIMEEAIGAKIADYLIKPINPSQILLSIKKLLDTKRIVTQKTNLSYQQEFQSISSAIGDELDHEDWADLYKKLIHWDLEINQTEHKSMGDVMQMQKTEANVNFTKFIKANYLDWITGDNEEKPIFSDQLIKEKVIPHLSDERPLFFFLIDNLRLDQWKELEPLISEYFTFEEDTTYFSILPTTTSYARNAIFAGMSPLDISQKLPEYWVSDNEEEGKNNYESELLGLQLKKYRPQTKYSYNKIIHTQQSKQVLESLPNLMNNDLNAIVINFVDMLSHARTDLQMMKTLAPDEAAYRSLTKSWFLHSIWFEMLKFLANKDVEVIITTDHGTVRVQKPQKIVGDRNTNTNLRYKQGKSLNYDRKHVFGVADPEEIGLPKQEVSSSYAFASEDQFFAYPNNYNHYVKYYKDTFQHGGISLEEMIIPFVRMKPKN